jgi:hypothetical protein
VIPGRLVRSAPPLVAGGEVVVVRARRRLTPSEIPRTVRAQCFFPPFLPPPALLGSAGASATA